MLKNNKLLRFYGLLCAVLLLALAGAGGQTALAAEVPPLTAVLEAGEWSDDEEPTLTVTLKLTPALADDPGLVGYQTRLYYDSNQLTPVNTGEPAQRYLIQGMGESCILTDASGSYVSIVDSDVDNISAEGSLFSVVFKKTNQYAPAAETSVRLEQPTSNSSLFYYNNIVRDVNGKVIHASLDNRSFSEDSVFSVTVTTLAFDRFEFTEQSDDLSFAGNQVSGDLTAQVLSSGNCYCGDARALLACYQNGKMVGLRIKNLTIETGKTVAVSFDNLSFALPGSAPASLKLFLLAGGESPTHAPLAAALVYSQNSQEL